MGKEEFEGNGHLSDVINEGLPPVEKSVVKSIEEPNTIEPETIFVWIDILGFSSLVENEEKYSTLLELLKNFYDAFRKLNKSADCHRISDGIILKLKPKFREISVVKEFFEDVMNVQKIFLVDKKLLRGGIAVGSKFNIQHVECNATSSLQENDDFYISNGLARAYNLESNSITWPIIGTNAEYLKKMSNLYGKEIRKIFSKTYSENKETIYYLNSYKLLNEKDQESVYRNSLKSITKLDKNPHVQHKYEWICKNLEKLNKKLTSIPCTICQRRNKTKTSKKVQKNAK